jgi:hypothetical protein
MPTKLDDLQEALSFADVSGIATRHAFVCLKTGKIQWLYDDPDEEYEITGIQPEEPPDDLDDPEKYAELPTRKELGLGKPLALEFARQHLAADFDDVRDYFSRKGAYRKFEALLIRRNRRDQWFDFERKAEERALRDWCAANGIEMAN